MLIEDRVNGVLREQLGPGYEWDQNTQLVTDDGLALDSLDVVELIMRLENEFRIEIPDEDLTYATDERPGSIALRPQYDRVRDVVTYLERRLAQTPALFA